MWTNPPSGGCHRPSPGAPRSRFELEYHAAIAEVERLLDEEVEDGSEGYDRLEFLSVLVEHYEDEHYPMGSVSPRQAVLFMLEQKGLSVQTSMR